MKPIPGAEYLAHWLQPDWPLSGVQGFVTTRYGNLNKAPFDGFNTADHVGDDRAEVAASRAALKQWLKWRNEPQWLSQTHGTQLVMAEANGPLKTADAVYSQQPGVVCTIHTADCLPIFIAAESQPLVALIHAGWRGLAAGILAKTLNRLPVKPQDLWIWFGPAIGPDAFEVGADVRQAMLALNTTHDQHFEANPNGRWQCDLYGIARDELLNLGCSRVLGGNYCTFADPRFFSFRQASTTGRLLSMLWLDSDQ